MSLTQEQLEMRRTGITATDATVLAGVSPYGRTAHDLYLDKMGESEPTEQTQAMGLGHRLEPIALAMLADERGLTIRPGRTERHPIMTWCVASPDGDIIEDSARVAVAEAKAVGFRMAQRWGESGDAETVPDEVRVQCQWQMVVARVKLAHVVAIIGTEVRYYDLEHDDDLSAALLELGDKFWRDHVLAKRAPAVDSSDGAARMVRGLFKRSTAGVVEAPAEAEELVRDYLAARDACNAAESAKSSAQAKLCAIIGEHEGLKSSAWLATWRTRAGSTDWKGLAEKLGATKELAEQYRRDGARVLNVKLAKESA